MLILFACFAAGCFPASVRAADDPAAALLAKHAAHAGWRGGDGSIKTLRESGDVTRDGKLYQRLSLLQMGALYRAVDVRSNGTSEGGFTGRVFGETNDNGFTIPVNGEVVKYLVTRAQIADEELTGLPGTVRGNETIGGVSTTVVRVVAQAGLPVDLSIDPASGAFERIVIDPGGRYETRLEGLADSDVGNGKRVLSSWHYGQSRAVYHYTKTEANTTMTPDELHPPKAAATWTFGPPAQTTPIEVTDKRISFEATVNGHPGHFIFDTGADGIVLTDSFARSAGAKRRGETRGSGIGGEFRANIYTLDTFAVGANTLHNVSATTGIDEGFSGRERFDGFIGFDLLAGAIVDMDLDARTMRMFDPAVAAPDRTQGFTLTVDLSTRQPRIPMMAGGRTAVDATLDTGDDSYVLFSAQLVSRDHVSFFSPLGSLASRRQFYGVNGNEVDTCGQLESLELGPITYRPAPACMSETFSRNEVLVGFLTS